MNKTILVVDDDPTIRKLCQLGLGKYFRVVEQENGLMALNWLRSSPTVSAFIIDVEMPHIDGCTLSKTIKQMAPYAATPLIMISSCPPEKVQQDCLDSGANLFLQKPCSPKELKTRVDMLLTGNTDQMSVKVA